ncbi:MAG: histidine kinase [Ruminococcus sp.]|nr:histidine kinase [Ruminococcus sp.]
MGYEEFIEMLDISLDTKRKRHIIGGMLMSVSLLFGGLALTAMTLDRGVKQ